MPCQRPSNKGECTRGTARISTVERGHRIVDCVNKRTIVVAIGSKIVQRNTHACGITTLQHEWADTATTTIQRDRVGHVSAFANRRLILSDIPDNVVVVQNRNRIVNGHDLSVQWITSGPGSHGPYILDRQIDRFRAFYKRIINCRQSKRQAIASKTRQDRVRLSREAEIARIRRVTSTCINQIETDLRTRKQRHRCQARHPSDSIVVGTLNANRTINRSPFGDSCVIDRKANQIIINDEMVSSIALLRITVDVRNIQCGPQAIGDVETECLSPLHQIILKDLNYRI